MTIRVGSRRRTKEPVRLPIAYEAEVEVPVELKRRDRGTGAELPPSLSTRTVLEEREEVFVFRGEMSSLSVAELAHYASTETADPAAMAVFRQIISAAFGDDAEYQRFLEFALKNMDDEDTWGVLGELMEAFANRPTQPSSVSQPPPLPTGDGSKVLTLPGGFQLQAPEESEAS